MISVFKTKKYISITGHAMYDDFGKDIVCSAVSSIVITTVNGILAIDSNALSCQITDNKVDIEIIKKDKITNCLINNMLDLLFKLSKDYPKNIQVKEGAKI